jgi:hypothetical protein
LYNPELGLLDKGCLILTALIIPHLYIEQSYYFDNSTHLTNRVQRPVFDLTTRCELRPPWVNFVPYGCTCPWVWRPSVRPSIESVHLWGWTKGWTFPLGDKVHPWGPTYAVDNWPQVAEVILYTFMQNTKGFLIRTLSFTAAPSQLIAYFLVKADLNKNHPDHNTSLRLFAP